MATATLERRLGALEVLTSRSGGDGEYVADIGGEDGRYWIDGIAVTQQVFAQRAPHGPFVVNLGDEVDDAQ